MRCVRLTVLCTGLLLVPGLAAIPAQATFPGGNGRIAFTSSRDRVNQIDTISPDGTGRTLLRSDAAGAVWSADGTRLLFVWNDPSPPAGFPFLPHNALRTIGADGTGEQVVFDPTSSVDHTWSPDGRRVAYTAPTQCDRFICFDDRIFTANIDGTGGAKLPNSPGALDVDWSPDGGKLAFGGNEIGTINTDGTGLATLTSGPDDSDPSWSPDGTEIAFSSKRDGNWEIYRMHVDGRGVTRLTNDPGNDENPVWSPDGSKIAFDRWSCPGTGCCPDAECTTSDVYVMNADGSGEVNLTNNPPPPGSRPIDLGPNWQPLPGPQRSDYKNAAKFCKAERDFLGDEAFTNKYGGGANAHGKCVSESH
jgi:Tol biopolymer transport system component